MTRFLPLLFAVAALNAQAGPFDLVTNAVKKAAEPALRGDSDGVEKAVTGSMLNDVNTRLSGELRASGNRPAAAAVDIVNTVEQAAIKGAANPSNSGNR